MAIEDTKKQVQDILMSYLEQEMTPTLNLAMKSELMSVPGVSNVNVDFANDVVNAKIAAWDGDNLEEWNVALSGVKHEEHEEHSDNQ